MKVLAVTFLLTLSACATQQTDPKSVSDLTLCEYTLSNSEQNRVVASNEAQRRGLDCRTYYPAIMAQREQQGRAWQDMANAIRGPQRQPMMIPPQVNCTSWRAGQQVYTSCN